MRWDKERSGRRVRTRVNLLIGTRNEHTILYPVESIMEFTSTKLYKLPSKNDSRKRKMYSVIVNYTNPTSTNVKVYIGCRT
jgi:hypothetical protein